ncbi:MAG: DUF4340 domain-containing protein [Planctomycetaceae bacterium]|nr:DUF4340 domain-containing protein [Planctomycetaceae bacterium]
MSDKRISFLGIVAAASVVLALVISQYANKTKPAASAMGSLVQGLDPAGIQKIIVKQGGKTVTLQHKGNEFVIAEKDGYPAATKVVNNLFTSSLDIKTVELYTEDEKNYADLGVTDADSQAMLTFYDAADKLITGFIIGKDSESGKGSLCYGRLVNDKKVYVLANVPWIRSEAVEYTNQDLIYIKKESIDWVTVTSPEGSYSLTADANGAVVKLKELPAGKKQKDSECQQVLGALSNLRFDDMMSEDKAKDLDFDRKFSLMKKDSTLISIEIAKKDSDTYIKCSVDFTDKTQVTKEQGVESADELKKKEAKLLAKESAMKLANATKGWVYKVPSYMGTNMTKPLADLVEDISKDANDVNTPKTAEQL